MSFVSHPTVGFLIYEHLYLLADTIVQDPKEKTPISNHSIILFATELGSLSQATSTGYGRFTIDP